MAWFSTIGRPNCSRSRRSPARTRMRRVRRRAPARRRSGARPRTSSSRPGLASAVPSRARGDPLVELLLAAEHAAAGDPDVVEVTSAVWEARMPCFLTFCPCSSPLVPGGMTKVACPREPSSGRRTRSRCGRWRSRRWSPRPSGRSAPTRRCLVVARRGCGSPTTSDPASGSEEQNAADLRVVRRAEHLRHPLDQLLGGPRWRRSPRPRASCP